MRLQILFAASFVLIGFAAFARAEQGGVTPPATHPAPSDAAPGDYRPGDVTPSSTGPVSDQQATDGQISGGQASGTAAEKPASPSTGDTWRFRWHRGQWWYWQPSNHWVYWSNDKWNAYEPSQAAPAPAAVTAPAPRRAQSYSGATQGPWGPIRYDSYGNRQYPYSRRNSGLQQLGPVPAMGGVRSLPGWGGER